MLTVLHITNPFDFHYDKVERKQYRNGHSIRSLLHTEFGLDFKDFEYPTFCLVNSEPYMRDRWNEVVPENAIVSFIRLQEGLVSILIAVVVVAVVAAVVALVVAKPKPGAVAATSPYQHGAGYNVYTLQGRQNQVRLNSAIECAYGKNKAYPSYAALPYSVFSGNDQYQYSLFCMGHGSFSFELLCFDDTPIQHFQDIEYEIVAPGQSFTLFPDDVYSSITASQIELRGPNEGYFTGWSGNAVANEAYTRTNHIQVDLSLPNGLYTINAITGKVESMDIAVYFQYQMIDDANNAPIGPWIPMVFQNANLLPSDPAFDPKSNYNVGNVAYFYVNLHTLTPQRFTMDSYVPSGRYQVRANRTNNKNLSSTSGNTVVWDGMRAFLPSTTNFGDVTLIGIKALATNNLNDQSAQKFNTVSTRCLPVWSPTKGWTLPVPTRNPVWAFCDVFRSAYGGHLPDSYLNLPELHSLATLMDLSNINFDYIFDTSATVWDTATTIALVCRGVPMIVGSQLTIVRDTVQTAPKQVFNAYNMVKNSLTWTVNLIKPQSYDGVEVSYIDDNTWAIESIVCLIGNDLGNNLEQITLVGCTDRGLAYHFGLYTRAVELYSREQLEFKTGLEGYLPTYGDLILVSHDVPNWGSGGYVKSTSGVSLILSDDVNFLPDVTHTICLRAKDGSAYGPVPVYPGLTAHDVLVDAPIPSDQFYFDDIHQPPYYLFGQTNLEVKRCTVTSIAPNGDDTITIQAVAYDDRIFSYDISPIPALGTRPKAITNPARPIVRSVKVSAIPGDTSYVTMSWPPALGAFNYIVDHSTNGFNWTRLATLPSTVLEVHVIPGLLWLRVAGVNTDVGPFQVWSGEVGDVTAIPTTVLGLAVTKLIPGSVTVGWTILANVDSYEVVVFQGTSGTMLRLDGTPYSQTNYTYDLDSMGVPDGLLGNTITILVKGENIKGQSATPASITITIPKRPIVLAHITADNVELTADSSIIKADHS